METSERWKRVKEIVGNALESPPGERSAFLDSACSGDLDLRAEAESLLAAHADAANLSRPLWETDATDDATPSQRVGPYKLVHILGVGGMGQVWLAEQTEPRPPDGRVETDSGGNVRLLCRQALSVRTPVTGDDGPPCHRQVTGVRTESA